MPFSEREGLSAEGCLLIPIRIGGYAFYISIAAIGGLIEVLKRMPKPKSAEGLARVFLIISAALAWIAISRDDSRPDRNLVAPSTITWDERFPDPTFTDQTGIPPWMSPETTPSVEQRINPAAGGIVCVPIVSGGTAYQALARAQAIGGLPENLVATYYVPQAVAEKMRGCTLTSIEQLEEYRVNSWEDLSLIFEGDLIYFHFQAKVSQIDNDSISPPQLASYLETLAAIEPMPIISSRQRQPATSQKNPVY
jgi:hypothetical protein